MLARRISILLSVASLFSGCDRPAPERSQPSAAPVASRSAPAAAPSPSVEPIASAPPPVSAEAPPPLPPPEPSPKVPASLVAHPPRPASEKNAGFAGPVDPGKDAALIERLASAPITEIVRNKGGATITLRARFADGTRAVLKPEQKHSASNLRAEIAAYHVDRILGFGRTAVVVGRSLGLEHLRQHLAHAGSDPAFLKRFDEEVVAREGRVSLAVIAWHAGRLASAEPPREWLEGLRSKEPVPPEIVPRLPEWSDLLVFDFLIDNTDRWSGGNVLSLGKGGPLIFLDNAAAFSRGGKGSLQGSRIEKLCRFRKATVAALRAVGPAAPESERLGARLGTTLGRDPLAPVLGERDLRAVDQRVSALIAHVDACVGELGEDVVLSL